MSAPDGRSRSNSSRRWELRLFLLQERVKKLWQQRSQPGGECPGIKRDLERLRSSSPESAGVFSLCGSLAAPSSADICWSSQVRFMKEAVMMMDGDEDIKGHLHLEAQEPQRLW